MVLSVLLAGTVMLGGPVRAKMDALSAERVFGADARGRIYEEAVNAFRTHYDDTRTPEQETGKNAWFKGRGLWQGEYWGKTMLSAAVIADLYGHDELKSWLREKALDFVREFQRPDGYLGSYRDPFFVGGPVPGKPGQEVFCWNLWGRTYTMWALLELSRVCGSQELLASAAKMMDQEIAQLKAKGVKLEDTGYFVGLPSMSVLKPLILLSGETGKAAYLDFADEIVAAWERQGNPAPNLVANAFGDRLVHEWYANPKWWAKAYEMMSCLEGLVAYAEVRREPRILEAVERIVAKLERGELNAVGCVGFFDHFTHAAACPNATTEPCDVTHWIRVNRELFLATGKAHYLDTLEFAFCNAFLAGVYRDGKWGAHSVRSHGTRHRTAPHQVGMAYHQCCIDNMPRTFVDICETVLSRGKDGALSVNLYGDARGTCGADAVRITGGYPFGNVVKVVVEHGPAKPAVAGASRADEGRPGRGRPGYDASRADVVRFRNPAWFDGLTLNGRPVTGEWAEAPLAPGENVFCLEFRRSPRLVDSAVLPGADARAGEFETAYENPEMKGLARTVPAARLFYGPLLLAKAKRLGATRSEILDFKTVNGRGFACTLRPLKASGVDGAWTAEFAKGGETFSVKVCDFASAADSDDPENLFSIWF